MWYLPFVGKGIKNYHNSKILYPKGMQKITTAEQRIFQWYSDILPFKRDRKMKLSD